MRKTMLIIITKYVQKYTAPNILSLSVSVSFIPIIMSEVFVLYSIFSAAFAAKKKKKKVKNPTYFYNPFTFIAFVMSSFFRLYCHHSVGAAIEFLAINFNTFSQCCCQFLFSLLHLCCLANISRIATFICLRYIEIWSTKS